MNRSPLFFTGAWNRAQPGCHSPSFAVSRHSWFPRRFHRIMSRAAVQTTARFWTLRRRPPGRAAPRSRPAPARSPSRRRVPAPRRAVLRVGVAERDQAAALPEQGIGALGDVPELVPALGRIGVERRASSVVPGCLGELGAAGAERVLGERCSRLDAIREPGGELGCSSASAVRTSSGRARRSRDRPGFRRPVRARAAAPRLLRSALGEQEPCGGRERQRALLRFAARADGRDSSSTAAACSCAPRSARRRSCSAAQLDEVDVAGRLQVLRQRSASASACSGRPQPARKFMLIAGDRERDSAIPRRSQKSIPSRQAASAACGPSYCQLTIARLLCSTAAARP